MTASFAPDPSFGNARGISGYHSAGANLFLSANQADVRSALATGDMGFLHLGDQRFLNPVAFAGEERLRLLHQPVQVLVGAHVEVCEPLEKLRQIGHGRCGLLDQAFNANVAERKGGACVSNQVELGDLLLRVHGH